MSEVRVATYSPGWDQGPTPSIAAVISTYRRPTFLADLVAALEAQSLDQADYEVIIVDNGSGDDTYERLCALAAHSPARLAVTQVDENRGPGGGRNHGFRLVRAPLACITDDDCLPTPGWLAAMADTFNAGADVIQGQVNADPNGLQAAGPWDHTKWINEPTPFFETCNVGYRVSNFRAVGGFDETDELTAQKGGGRAFGEDALLAWRVVEHGGKRAFAPESLVHHRVISGDFSRWLDGQRNLVGFPGLGNRSPLVAQWFWRRYFLSRHTALFDLAVLCLVAALVTRRPWLVLGVLWWARDSWDDALRKSKFDKAVAVQRLAQLAVADGVSLASLVKGSIRHRRLLL